MYEKLIIIILCSVTLTRTAICPEGICSLVQECPSSPQSQDDCPPLTSYTQNIWHCDCCPACVKYKLNSELCENDGHVEGSVGTNEEFITSTECGPGLSCIENVCEPIDEINVHPCWDAYKEYLEVKDTDYWVWEPDCDEEGYFKPKQCKGNQFDGRCHCVDEYGEIIFGDKWIKDDADEMTCKCSRQYNELVKAGVIDITLVCTSEGNYREFQCQNDYCFCVNSTGNNETSTVVPEDMKEVLPCYRDSYEVNYLESCALELHRQKSLEELLSEKGTILLSYATPSCNPDQTFTAVQCYDNSCVCITLDNALTTATCSIGAAQNCSDMNCFCIRDEEELASEGTNFPYTCNPDTGNYEPLQNPRDGVYLCVDETGYQDSNITALECCLECSTEDECSGPQCNLEPVIVNMFMK